MIKHVLGLSLFLLLLTFNAGFAQTSVSGSVSGSWTKAQGPYVLTGTVTIPAGLTLTIEPGTVVELPNNNFNITVNGTLIAQGTPTDSIRFRRPRIAPSTEYGGGLFFRETSGASVLQYAALDSLGDNYWGNAAINIDLPAMPTVQNVNVRRSESYAVKTWIGGARNFANMGAPMMVGITANAGALNATIPRLSQGSFYRLLVNTTVDQNQTLTIEPGTVVELPNNNFNITVNGTLIAQGTPTDSIRFRRPRIAPSTEYGGGLFFRETSGASVLQYAALDSLGDNYWGNAAINIDLPAMPTVQNVNVRRSESYAVKTWIGGARNFANMGAPMMVGITANAGALNATIPRLSQGSFYRLLVNTIVDQNQTLTIEPGTVVELPNNNFNINVNGTLIAQGTAADSIRFRRPRIAPSTEYGGGLFFRETSGASVLQYATLDSLGDNYWGNAAINISSNCTVKNILIKNSEQFGITITSGSPSPIVQNNLFLTSPIGIRAYATNFSNLSNNTNAKLLINSGPLAATAIWPLPGTNSYYQLAGQVVVPQSNTLTIASGVLVDFGLQGGEIYVNGTLRAIGTANAPIRLSRLQSTTASVAGGRVYLSASSTNSTLNFVTFDKLGNTQNSYAALDIATANFSAGNITISNSQSRGLQLANVGQAAIAGSNFFGNKTGVYVSSGRPIFANCNIYSNTDFGINNVSSAVADTVNARNSYWGSSSGPLHPTRNPNGTGNKVSDKVLFTPWVEQVVQVDQTINFAEIQNKYVDDTLVLAATATSSLPVSFSINTQPVSNVALLTGNTITFPGAVGQVTITAYQPGNESFKPAQLQRTFTVSKRNQSITVNAIPAKKVGDAPFSLTATATSGLPVSFSIVSGPATLNGNTLTLTGAGTVVIEARQTGDRVYNQASSVQQSFGVTLPTLSITNLPSSTSEGQTVTFNVATNVAPTSPLTVFLQSSNPTRFPVPASVTIAAGNLSTAVSVTLVQNNIPQIDQAVTITAGASNNNQSTATILVKDDDLPNLELVILPTTISESAGANATQAILRRTSSSTIAFTANLSASRPNTLVLPSTISLAEGENEKTFTIGVVDNSLLDGQRLVTVTASLYVASCGCNAPATSSGSVSATVIVNDDDGPSLSLTGIPQTLREGLANAGTLRITRNGPTTSALSVTLTSSDLTEATLPTTTVIPAGQTFVDIAITTLDDGITDGNQTVYFTATATGLAAGSTFVIVTDLNLPDLQIPLVQLSSNKIQASTTVNYQVSVKNSGWTTAPGGTVVRGYLSTDNVIDASDILLSEDTLSEAIPAGQTKILAKSVKTPIKQGTFKLLYWANPNETLNELLFTNNVSAPVSITIDPAYTVTASVAPLYFLKSTTVPITGSATKIGGSPAANVPVEIYVITNGIRRTLSDTTDASGNFSVPFIPLPSEAGHYVVGGSFPGLNQTTAQDGFDILGVRINSGNNVLFTTTQNEPLSGYVTVENLSGKSLSNFTLAPVTLPTGATVQFAVLPNVAGTTSVNLGYTVSGTALTGGNNYEEAILQAKSDEGVIQNVKTYYYCQAARAFVVADVANIQASVAQSSGERRIDVKLINKGKAATGIITINLPTVNWLTSVTSKTLTSLAPGDTAVVVLKFSALSEVPVNNPINGTIGINVVNGNSFSLPFTFRKVSEATGTARIVVTNQYTYNTNNGNGPNVKDAQVKITNYYTGEVYAQGNTTEQGVFIGANIPEGKHRIKVEKDKHLPYEDVLEINPGATTESTVFLNYQAITFSWNVVPTTVEDQYETVLEAKFETNVPMPVVTIEMPKTMPELSAGQSYQFMITLTNHGLITAEEVTLNLPTTDSEYEFITNYLPGDLLAKQSIQIPVVMRRRIGSAGGRSSALVCIDFAGAAYKYKCSTITGLYDKVGTLFSYSGRICLAGSGGPCYNCYPLGGGTGAGSVTIPNTQEKTKCEPCAKEIGDALFGCVPGSTIPQLLVCYATTLIDESNLNKGYSLIECAVEGAISLIPVVGCLYGVEKALKCKRKTSSGGRLAAGELPNAVLDEISGNVQVVIKGYTALNSWMTEYFGDIVNKEGRTVLFPLIKTYLGTLTSIPGNVQSNIIAAMEGYDIPSATLSAFFTRWNTSLEAKANNVLAPNAAYPNIINWNKVDSNVVALIQAHNYSVNRGFKTIDGMHKESIKSLNEIIDGEQNGVCASVTVQFNQQLTMTREAFEGTLEIFNGHPTDAMKTISVNIQINDENGTPSNGLFEIQPQNPANPADINAQQKGTAKFLFIPRIDAAPQTAKVYKFGGSVTYWDPYVEAMVTMPLTPVPITVNPSPNLMLHYFMERNILGDDALTSQEVEPSLPAELAVMIENKGYGPARDMVISSAQPKIVDNEKGLAVDFKLIGSNIQGQPVQLGLTNINFGTIDPLKTKIGQWYFTSSLLGKFVSYDAKVVHKSSFGNKDLSLIQGVQLHELTKSIRLYGELEDGITDFLVNDIFDVNDVPDIVYFSQGNRTAKVSPATSGSFNAPVSGPTFTNTLTVTPSEAGFNYIKLPDPGNRLYELVSVTRSDGQVIPLNNAWLTFVTLPVLRSPIYENKFHIVDNFATAASTSYTVVWKPKNTNGPKVDSIAGAPTQVSSTQIKNLRVYFNKRIDPATFTYEDMTLSLQGGPNIMSPSVVITQLDSASFNIDLTAITTGSGQYVFTAQAANVKDVQGSSGTSGKQVSWSQFISPISFTGLNGTYCSNATSQTLVGTPTGGTFSGPGVTGNVFNPAVAGVGSHTITYSKDGQSFFQTTVISPVPNLVISPASTTLTCAQPTASLTAISSTTGVSYRWSGPNSFTASSANPTINTPGIYSVTAMATGGCSNVASITIASNTTTPTATLTASGTLTCAQTSVTLTAGGGTAYRFSSSGVVSTSANVAIVNAAGTYSVTVTAANGCTASQTTTVFSNTSVPTATLSASGTLTCAQTSVTLTAGGGSSYRFAGPSVVTMSGNVAVVNVGGPYSVTVTGANGCTASQTTTVFASTTATPVSLTTSGPLSCSTTRVTLTATAGFTTYYFSPGATQSAGTSSNTALVNTSGTYSVTAINASGCSSTSVVSVTYQNCPPTVANTVNPQSATVGQAFSLNIPANTFTDAETPNSLTLSVSGLPAGLIFTAPTTISGTPSTTVGSPFSVTVSATDSGGLTVRISFNLTVNPAATAPTGFTITSVSLVSCSAISSTQRRVVFNPVYSGLTGQPISFSVVNEQLVTINPGPYTLNLFTDNPVIQLRAVQQGSPQPAMYNFSWLAACTNCSQMVTVKAGSWNDPSVWSCGRVPVSTDVVTISHAVSLPASYQGQALRVIYNATGKLSVNTGSSLRLNGN
ncbi:hypothetical protein GCM10028807_45350 [Spirosoma daeguense]